MQRFSKVDEDDTFSVAFEAVWMSWAKYIVAFEASVLYIVVMGKTSISLTLLEHILLPP